MADAFIELGATGIDKLTDKYYDIAYDSVTKKKPGQRVTEIKEQIKPRLSGNANQRKQRNRLPSPEGDVDRRDKDFYADRGSDRPRRRRDSSLERESLTSAQVLDEYESERTDPPRKPESVLSKRDLNTLRRDSKVGSSRMSYANGYAFDRPRSQQPPRNRYYDDDDSDYDERTGRRYGATGRGYDDREYDREIVETEQYRGVSDAPVVSAAFHLIHTLLTFLPARPTLRRPAQQQLPHQPLLRRRAGWRWCRCRNAIQPPLR